jgi:hypothetical protein
LSVIDEIVNKAADGKKLHPLYYPQMDVKHLREISQKLKGHTNTQIQLARRARDLPGGGVMNLVNTAVKIAKPAAKIVWKGMKAGAKLMYKGVKVGAKWIIAHPEEALKIGATIVNVGTALISREDDSEPESEEIQGQHKEAIDDLLMTTDDEKKGGALVPIRRQKPKRDNARWTI